MREADRVRQDFEHLIEEEPMKTSLSALQMEMLLDIRELLTDLRDLMLYGEIPASQQGDAVLDIDAETNRVRLFLIDPCREGVVGDEV